MTVDEVLSRFGLHPRADQVSEIREILAAEIDRERRGVGDTEVIRLLCVELFAHGDLHDVFLIWRAKTSSWDASRSIDVQLLCGAGLENTKRFLAEISSDEAGRILELMAQSEDLAGFSVDEEIRQYELFYSGDD